MHGIKYVGSVSPPCSSASRRGLFGTETDGLGKFGRLRFFWRQRKRRTTIGTGVFSFRPISLSNIFAVTAVWFFHIWKVRFFDSGVQFRRLNTEVNQKGTPRSKASKCFRDEGCCRVSYFWEADMRLFSPNGTLFQGTNFSDG